MQEQTKKKIEDTIQNNKVVLFMKGTREMPQCGFSAAVIECLTQLNADYQTVDILMDEEIRSGIKTYSNWPTIPQLYINGEFVGGCDIVRELYSTGELKKMVDSALGRP